MKKLPIFFALIFLCSSGFAANFMMYEWADGASDVVFDASPDAKWSHAYSEIAYDTNQGKKIVSFSLVPTNKNEGCRLGYTSRRSDIVFSVNGQAIQGGIHCRTYTNSGARYYSFWASTERGNSFIVQSLLATPKQIMISTPLVNFPISTVDFNSEWSKRSAGAL